MTFFFFVEALLDAARSRVRDGHEKVITRVLRTRNASSTTHAVQDHPKFHMRPVLWVELAGRGCSTSPRLRPRLWRTIDKYVSDRVYSKASVVLSIHVPSAMCLQFR